MRIIPICVLILASGAVAFAERDFLTSDEVEKVRDAQEPNERLKLYVLFARQRMDQLQQAVSKEKKGRSLAIRELLQDYAGIIDAIDNVTDDALKRKATLTEGPTAVTTAEQRFLTQLKKIQDNPPSDLDLYDIELKEAIDATSDSIELAQNDPGKRAAQLIADEEKAKKKAEAMISAEDSKGAPVDESKAESTGATAAKSTADKPVRKPPTLYRPGEKPPDSAQPTTP